MKALSSFKYNYRDAGEQILGPISYGIDDCSAGMVLVGKTAKGICTILLGDSEEELHVQLIQVFPQMVLVRDPLLRELQSVVSLIDNGKTDETIVLDIGGTPFQQTVWRAICEIPAGHTSSYTEIAERLGMLAGARAVAGACAANRIAIAVPCHRVLREDGTISGYRWGIERKQAILANEGMQ